MGLCHLCAEGHHQTSSHDSDICTCCGFDLNQLAPVTITVIAICPDCNCSWDAPGFDCDHPGHMNPVSDR